MDSELIQSHNRDDIPQTQHRVFRGIMLGFLLSIIVLGSVSIVSAQVTTPGGGVPGSNPFVEEQIREPDIIHFATMNSYDVDFIVLPFSETNFIIGVNDVESIIDNRPYTFMFGMKFK